jgi:hypothetical protein
MAKIPFLKGLQVYFSVPWSRKPLTLRSGPPWQLTGLKGLSLPQLKAVEALIDIMVNTVYGKVKGKLPYRGISMPASAVTLASTLAAKKLTGPKVHGGMTPAERAAKRHEAALATLAYVKSLIAEKAR